MLKYRLFMVFFIILGIYCSDITARPLNNAGLFNIKETNRVLDEITKQINNGAHSRTESANYIETIATIQMQTLNAQEEDSNQLAILNQKLATLENVNTDGEKELPELSKQRKDFENDAREYKVRLAQEALILTKIDELNSLILKARHQELLNSVLVKQSSIFQLEEFWNSLISFGQFLKNVVLSPMAWYKKLTIQEQLEAKKSFGFFMFLLGFSLIFAFWIISIIKNYFGYDNEIKQPSSIQKFQHALVHFIRLSIIPSVAVLIFYIWINNFELMTDSDFALFLKTFALYFLYFMLFRAGILVSFTPKHPEWRIFNIDKRKIFSSAHTLIFVAMCVAIVSFLQNLALVMNHNQEIIYSMLIFANGIKAFAIIWSVLTLFYNSKDISDEDLENDNMQKLSFLSQMAILIVFFMVVSFGFSLFGYIRLSEYLINRFIISALVYCVFYLLNNFFRVAYSTLIEQKFLMTTFRISPRSLSKSKIWFGIILTPILYSCGFLILLAVWGVSVDILLAKVKGILTGFNIGEVRVSITSIILGLFSFWVAMLLIKMLQSSLQKGSLSKLAFDDGMKNSIISGIGFFGFIFSVILGIAVAGGSFKSLALMAGAISFGAGLGLQNIVSNLVAGITILFERPIKLGDLVIINGYEGTVKQISMRATFLEMNNKSNVIIPNSAIIAGSVINRTYESRMGRLEIKVGVDYNSNIALVKNTLLKIATDDDEILKNPAPTLAFIDFGDNSLDFQLNCYTANISNRMAISFRLREKIIQEFRKLDINIPFPQRVIQIADNSITSAIDKQ